MLRDGAVTVGYLDSTTAAQRTFKRGVDRLLRSIDLEVLPPPRVEPSAVNLPLFRR